MGVSDRYWMNLAILEAKKAEKMGEVPVGAVLIKDDKLLASAHNQPIKTCDPTAHAEIKLLQAAGKKLSNYRLLNTTIFITLEPCPMCFAAITHARITRLVFATPDPKTGACGGAIDLTTATCFNHKIKVEQGLLATQSKTLLTNFFQSRR